MVGFRLISKITRPDKDLVAAFAALDTGQVSDSVGKLYTMDPGMRAHTNMVAFGFSQGQPIRSRPSTSASRRARYVAAICSTHSWGPFRATIAAIWIGWNAP